MMYIKPINNAPINKNISKKAFGMVLKFTAQGYMKMTSTSNMTNKMAVKKYLIDKGTRALPLLSIPHSNEESLAFVFRFGPNKCVETITIKTKPAATKNWMKIEI